MPNPPDAADRMTTLVRKLLTLAETPGTPQAEAEAAFEKAAKIMAAYELDEAQVRADHPDQAVPLTVADREYAVGAPYASARALLFGAVARHFGVRVIRKGDTTRSVQRLRLFGAASDIDMTIMLFQSLLLQAAIFEPRDLKEARYRRDFSPKSFRHAWMLGFAHTIDTRLQATKRAAMQEHVKAHGNGAELVLVNKSALIDRKVAEAYPKLGNARRVSVGSSSGWTAGRASGQRADVGQARVGGSHRALSS